MNSRERVLMSLNHKEPDKVPKYEWYWEPTIIRWNKEGLDNRDVLDLFSMDIVQFNIDNSPMFEREILEEDGHLITFRDEWGCIQKDHKDHSSTPQFLDFPVKSQEMWENEYKPLLKMDNKRKAKLESDVNIQLVGEKRSKGKFIVVGGLLNFEAAWRKVGMENLLMLMPSEPDYVTDIFETDTRLILEMLKEIVDAGIEIDGLFWAEDMAYKDRLLFSPAYYRTFLKDLHKEFIDFAHDQNWKVIMHSDGYLNDLLPDLIDIGLDCIEPLEVKAGMDMIALKQQYGDSLAFMGGMDVRVWEKGDLLEFEKYISDSLKQVKKGGGYIFMSDHSIPPTISFDLYQKQMEIVEKYLTY